jgi:hypothetical protein
MVGSKLAACLEAERGLSSFRYMKRELSPFQLASFLILGCIICRLLNSLFPEVMPNVSPLLAIAYVGAMYLPRKWGWLMGPVALIITDLAFLRINLLTDGTGSMFSWWTVVSLVTYALIGGLGILISQRKSLAKIITGSLVGSLVFYVAANTFSWWHDMGLSFSYAPTLAGWWQANTVGLSGYAPTWHFLRNGMAGDLFFVLLMLLVLDRGLLFGQAPAKASAQAA